MNVHEDAFENGTVMQADENRLTVSLRALDTESGISKIYFAVLSDGLIPSTNDYKAFDFAATIDIEGYVNDLSRCKHNFFFQKINADCRHFLEKLFFSYGFLIH